MRWFRNLFLLTSLLTLGALVWAGVYARKQGFTRSWRGAVEREFAERGYHVDIGKVTLGAFRGLVAENVTFFEDETRREGVATLDRVSLDVDLSRILQKRVAVNSFDVEEAMLSLPLDPARPQGRRLVVEGISGRVVFTESMIEVLRAEASLGELALEIKGSLTRSPEPSAAANRRRDAVAGEALAGFRRFAERLLDELDHYEFSSDSPPLLQVTFRGGAEDLATTSVALDLETGAVTRRGSAYRLESLSARGHYHGSDGRFEMEALEARDASGDLRLSAAWDPSKEALAFEFASSLELPGLAAWFSEEPRWREAVFFSSPKIRAEGRLRPGELKAPQVGFPGEILGELQAARFVTRGVVFEGLDFGFRAEGQRLYLRNARLDHRSGVAFLNLMHDPALETGALRYQAEIKLDPSVFQPFLGEEARRFLAAWSFADTSTVYLAAAGSGAGWEPATWSNRGVVQLRHFWLNGVDFAEMNAEFESDAAGTWLKEIALQHPDGRIGVELARYDAPEKRWEVRGGSAQAPPAETARAFHPGLDAKLGGIRFSEPPLARFSGEIDARPEAEIGDGLRRHRLELAFEAEAPAAFPIAGRELRVERSRGTLSIDGAQLSLREFRGETGGGAIHLDHEIADSRDASLPFALTARLESFPAAAIALPGSNDPAPAADLRLGGELRIEGRASDTATWSGKGQLDLGGDGLLSHPLATTLLQTAGIVTDADDDLPASLVATVALDSGNLQLESATGRHGPLRLVAAGEWPVGSDGELAVEAALLPIARPGAGAARNGGASQPRGFAASGTLLDPSWEQRPLASLARLSETAITELRAAAAPQEEVANETADASSDGDSDGEGEEAPQESAAPPASRRQD